MSKLGNFDGIPELIGLFWHCAVGMTSIVWVGFWLNRLGYFSVLSFGAWTLFVRSLHPLPVLRVFQHRVSFPLRRILVPDSWIRWSEARTAPGGDCLGGDEGAGVLIDGVSCFQIGTQACWKAFLWRIHFHYTQRTWSLWEERQGKGFGLIQNCGHFDWNERKLLWKAARCGVKLGSLNWAWSVWK